MSNWLLIVVSSLYLGVGISEALKDNWYWLGFWACYAAANLFWIKAQVS